MTAQTTNLNNKNEGDKHQPELSASKSKKKQILSYVFLPGIGHEIKQLTQGRFGYLAYLIALIYQMVRILPKNHPYTLPKNIGRFTIRQAVAAAANNITLDKKNIDQIIVFIAILAALALGILQIISFLFFIFMGSAFAADPLMFITGNPNEDIAFYMIREVFGLPKMFGVLKGGQTALHLALQDLFLFYNFAILFVAIIIFLYYVVVVIAETAQTGVPFGQRFSHIYAPFRLVIAIGLLVPLHLGFNGAQYMAFHAAKLGSSFATFGWSEFNKTLSTSNPLGAEKASLIAQPNAPDLTGLVETMSVIVACREAYFLNEGKVITAYFVDNGGNAVDISIGAFVAMRDQARLRGEKGHVSIYFGDQTVLQESSDPGKRTPYCGEVKIPIQEDDKASLNLVGLSSPNYLQEEYFRIVWFLWETPTMKFIGQRFAQAHIQGGKPCAVATAGNNLGNCNTSYKPPASYKKDRINTINGINQANINILFRAIRAQVKYTIEPEILAKGWGGAGIWYNKIAQINGSYVSVVSAIPNIHKWPQVMQKILESKQKSDGAFNDCKAYEPNVAGNDAVKIDGGEKDKYYAKVLSETYQYWRCDKSGNAANFFWDSMSAVFGLNGLFNIRDTINVPDGNGNTIETTIHPLAQLSTIGKSLVDSAVRNMAMAMGMSFGGGMLGVLSQHLGSGLAAASSMFVSIATVGLSVGFILYYILPFLPFMYFFFAVGGWVKGLFEAMIGAPLWALAHLRIDGDGLPGRSAMSGYLLIFEIFLRPILTVFGLIAGLAIFTTSATILNEIFDIAVTNVTGAEATGANATAEFGRNIVDEFFFTVVYAIILYMMATASFKMITLVPNNILRWLGQSVSTFNDQSQDPTAGLTQYAAMGGARIGGQLAQGGTQLAQGAGSAIGEFAKFGLGTRT